MMLLTSASIALPAGKAWAADARGKQMAERTTAKSGTAFLRKSIVKTPQDSILTDETFLSSLLSVPLIHEQIFLSWAFRRPGFLVEIASVVTDSPVGAPYDATREAIFSLELSCIEYLH
jgi:hypothetical protein